MLPELFRGRDLTVRFQWTSKNASQYLYLWKCRGLVESLGGHSDLYANLLRAPHPDWDRAVVLAMPSAVLIGIEVLRRAGWTTQVPQTPDLAVKRSGSVFTLQRYRVHARSPAWFDAVKPGLEKGEAGRLPSLRPAWALADLLHGTRWGECGLGPDDIDWSLAADRDRRDWDKAVRAFGLPPTPFEEATTMNRGA